MNLALLVAWKIVTHSPRRLFLSVCGMAFSILIMFLELGFYNGLTDSQSLLPGLLNADLVLLNARRTNFLENHRFNPQRLSMVAAYEEVAESIPFYEGFTSLRNPQTGQFRKIYALAFPPGGHPLRLNGMEQLETLLKPPATILYDRRSRYIFGTVDVGRVVVLGDNRPYQVVGQVTIGPNFGYDGFVLMSSGTWHSLGNDEDVSLGLIRLKPGVDRNDLLRRLNTTLPGDVIVLTPEALRQREVAFTRSATPSGILLTTGMVVGLVIGVTICYQILFTTIHDHWPQYAMLKAIGFTDGFLVQIVMGKALLLSLLGYVPGLLASLALYAFIEDRTSIIMNLTVARMLTILPLALFMCVLAGLLAIRTVARTDPAELY